MRHQLASEGWLEALEEVVLAHIDTADITGIQFTLAEKYLGVPPEISADGVVGWHCMISGGRAVFGRGAPHDADLLVIADFERVRDSLQELDPDDHAAAGARAARAEAALASGQAKMIGDRSRLPPLFVGLHDKVAAITEQSGP